MKSSFLTVRFEKPKAKQETIIDQHVFRVNSDTVIDQFMIRDFSTLLKSVSATTRNLLMVGGFNFHVYDSSDKDGVMFNQNARRCWSSPNLIWRPRNFTWGSYANWTPIESFSNNQRPLEPLLKVCQICHLFLIWGDTRDTAIINKFNWWSFQDTKYSTTP